MLCACLPYTHAGTGGSSGRGKQPQAPVAPAALLLEQSPVMLIQHMFLEGLLYTSYVLDAEGATEKDTESCSSCFIIAHKEHRTHEGS